MLIDNVNKFSQHGSHERARLYGCPRSANSLMLDEVTWSEEIVKALIDHAVQGEHASSDRPPEFSDDA